VPFRLSTAAAGDLDGIRAFTLERWGRAQWLAYYGALARTFERIAAEPGTGRRRDGFRPGMRSVPCRAHVVFYVELGGGVIGIVRVLLAQQRGGVAVGGGGVMVGASTHPTCSAFAKLAPK
jgi:toxin ParE1/3/4